MLWGASAFIYTVIFTHLGTVALAGSQIVMVIENLFIAAAAGSAPAAIASIGQAIGAGSIGSAKKNAGRVLRLGILAGLFFTFVLVGAGFLLSFLYPRVGKDVLQVAFWGILIAATVQPVKVLNSILGNGICRRRRHKIRTRRSPDRKLPGRHPRSRFARNFYGIKRMGCIWRPRA